ncbi:MAG: hypothetical protein AB1486_24570 [Planctomycetota bacterium]
MGRTDLAEKVEQVVDPGGWSKAAVVVCRAGPGRIAVKDTRRMNGLVRFFYGRWVQWREIRVLRRLEGVTGVPRFYGRIDAQAFAMEWVDGVHLNRGIARGRFASIFRSLETTIRSVHARGVVHLDLHEKKNILITPDDQAFLLDFATALYLGGLGLPGRLAVRLLGRLDGAALLKFKGRFAPELLTPRERRRLRWLTWLTRLWIPKRLADLLKELGSWLGLRHRQP